jgi:hypothetical protein
MCAPCAGSSSTGNSSFYYSSAPEKLRQDDTLSLILEDLYSHEIHIRKQRDTSIQSKVEEMLLIDIKTE